MERKITNNSSGSVKLQKKPTSTAAQDILNQLDANMQD
jgi:hypothetical protein